MAVFLAASTRYTKATASQPDTHDGIGRAYGQHRTRGKNAAAVFRTAANPVEPTQDYNTCQSIRPTYLLQLRLLIQLSCEALVQLEPATGVNPWTHSPK